MTHFGAVATGMEHPDANVLVNASGTRKTKAALISDLGTAEVDNPVYRVPAGYRLYEKGDLVGDPGNPVNYRQVLTPGMLVSSDAINGMFPAPTITSVTPAAAAAAGGTPITIKGTNFKSAGTSATLGAVACTSVVVVDSTTITAVTPAKSAGTYDVVVTTDSDTATATGAVTTS